MATPTFNPTYSTVTTDGVNLRIWHQGTAPKLLILIHGGMGGGIQYNASIPALSQKYTVCTYDRRGNNASTIIGTKSLLNPAQSARDIYAIMNHLNFSKASLYGTSGAGLIAMQFGIMFPDKVEHIIAYETPLYSIMDDSTHWLDFSMQTIEAYKTHGTIAAQARFADHFKGLGGMQKPKASPSADFFYEYEFAVFTLYVPNLAKLKEEKVSVVVAAGAKSEDAPYARSTVAQAEILGCKRLVWPGHHIHHEADPEQFTKLLLGALEELDGEK